MPPNLTTDFKVTNVVESESSSPIQTEGVRLVAVTSPNGKYALKTQSYVEDTAGGGHSVDPLSFIQCLKNRLNNYADFNLTKEQVLEEMKKFDLELPVKVESAVPPAKGQHYTAVM